MIEAYTEARDLSEREADSNVITALKDVADALVEENIRLDADNAELRFERDFG